MSSQEAGPSRFAFRRTEKLLAALERAKKQISEEIRVNDGIYPQNRGLLTQAELCRRAGISQATLQNPIHKTTTLVKVNQWLGTIRESMIIKRAPVGTTTAKQIDPLKDELQKMATHYNISRLEVADLKSRLAAAVAEIKQFQERIAKLEDENVMLQSELSQGRVVRPSFPRAK